MPVNMQNFLINDPVKISATDTAKMVKAALKEKFPDVKFSVTTHKHTGGASHIADFVAFDVWRSKLLFHGHEVKCSRSDWLVELRQPWKSESIKRYMDFWWLVVADKNVVKEGELPEDWGLLVVSGSGLRAVKVAPRLTPEPMPKLFTASFSRATQRTAMRRASRG